MDLRLTSRTLFRRVLAVQAVLGIALPLTTPMSTMWDHRRHLGNNVVYPDEFLNHLGYLDNGHGSWMHTRSERQEAIRFYQRENGLAETGKIDRSTWALMKKPRCAVPDVGVMSPGPSRVERRGVLNRRRRAAPGQKAINLDTPTAYKWIIPHLKWRPTRLAHTIPVDKQRALFTESFRRWSKPSNIMVTETYGEPEIDIEFGRREHGDGRGNAFDGKGMLLAHAFPPGDLDISGDIHFDSDERWTHGVNDSDSRDLMMIAMHEAGHALGLPHSKNRYDIMYPVYLDYDPNPQLNKGDVRQLQKLYGKRPGYVMPKRKKAKAIMTRKQRRRFRVNKRLPRFCRSKFNAVVVGPNKEGYVFSKTQVYRINNEGTLPGYPVHVGHEFPGAPINPTTVFYVPEKKKFYFFKDDRIWRFTNHTLDKGYPMTSKTKFYKKVRSAIAMRDYRGRTMVFFFSDKLTWRWNYNSERLNGRYRLTSLFWKGLPKTFDASVEWYDGYIYFFKHNRYFKVSKHTKVVMKGYPQFKGSAWLGGECGADPK